MRVSEVFYSLQGEGMLAGTPSVFVRLAGCPLRCRWCDTKYAWDYQAGEDLSPAQIVERVSQWPCRFVVLTGGEPMMGPDLAPRAGLVDLTQRLRVLGKHITMETAGVLFMPGLACDLMSISPKSSGSITSDPETVGRLIRAYPYQLKFVVESPEDIGGVQDMLGKLVPLEPERVMLMPQAATMQELQSRSAMVAELCKRTGLRFGPRLHIQLWGQCRGV
ncbi:MAG: 7-carboxy-7-deazaguanine synthase QueE [Sedimentisphaerales bacterium]|nr:7-carboxy-7-deazaguanine synthase QueE [Sedimentisphaerales bacterium]